MDTTQSRADQGARQAPRARSARSALALAGLLAGLTSAPSSAHAADGCLVLLCLAAPSWRAIAQCVPPVKEVLRDLARGKPFPSCAMSGAGNGADNRRSSAPDFCPSQYTVPVLLESGTAYWCQFDGAVGVTINGSLWSRTWWSLRGDSVTEFSQEAKAAMGVWETRFDDDYAAWLAMQPPAPPPVCPPSC